jgi:hypothetical protein
MQPSQRCAALGKGGWRHSCGAAALQNDIELSRDDFLRRFGLEPDPTAVPRSSLVIVAEMQVRPGWVPPAVPSEARRAARERTRYVVAVGAGGRMVRACCPFGGCGGCSWSRRSRCAHAEPASRRTPPGRCWSRGLMSPGWVPPQAGGQGPPHRNPGAGLPRRTLAVAAPPQHLPPLQHALSPAAFPGCRGRSPAARRWA